MDAAEELHPFQLGHDHSQGKHGCGAEVNLHAPKPRFVRIWPRKPLQARAITGFSSPWTTALYVPVETPQMSSAFLFLL